MIVISMEDTYNKLNHFDQSLYHTMWGYIECPKSFELKIAYWNDGYQWKILNYKKAE